MHHVTNTYGEVEVSDLAFVIWVLDATGQLHAPRAKSFRYLLDRRFWCRE